MTVSLGFSSMKMTNDSNGIDALSVRLTYTSEKNKFRQRMHIK